MIEVAIPLRLTLDLAEVAPAAMPCLALFPAP